MVLTSEVVKSSAIEGEFLNADQVRSPIARRPGLDAAGLPKAGRFVEGIVEMMLDATRNFESPLTCVRPLSSTPGLRTAEGPRHEGWLHAQVNSRRSAVASPALGNERPRLTERLRHLHLRQSGLPARASQALQKSTVLGGVNRTHAPRGRVRGRRVYPVPE